MNKSFIFRDSRVINGAVFVFVENKYTEDKCFVRAVSLEAGSGVYIFPQDVWENTSGKDKTYMVKEA